MLRQTLLRTTRSRLAHGASVSVPRRAASSSPASTVASLVTDDSANIGDYPTTIPASNRQLRSCTASWDNQQERRNFGETLHEEDEILAVFSPDVHKHVSPARALAHVAAIVAVVYAVTLWAKASFEPLHAVRRTYPFDGLEKELGGHTKARSE